LYFHQLKKNISNVIYMMNFGRAVELFNKFTPKITGGRRQEAGGRRQEAGGRRYEIGDKKQKAGGWSQQTGGRQKAGGRRHNARYMRDRR
jgi:hypothetical protein